jgi:hypothetical protein
VLAHRHDGALGMHCLCRLAEEGGGVRRNTNHLTVRAD